MGAFSTVQQTIGASRVDLLLAGGEADGARRELRGEALVGLVRQLAQRRGVDPAAVLGQRQQRLVGLAGVGRPEVEDDLLGADGADRELRLGALHPALLGEALDAGGGAVVVAGPALTRVGALSAAGGVLRGFTHRSEASLR